ELALSAPGSPLLIVYFSRAVRSQESRFKLLREGLEPDAYAEILLQELDTEQTGRMVRGLLAFEEVPPALLPAIDKHAQGNPFFIEEIVKTLLEDGSLIHREKGWTLTRELAEIHVPDTVQGVLAARIDRLEAGEKEVLQHAAIIGRSFPQQVLGSLFEREIESDLEVLRERDFLIKPEKEVSMDDWEWLFRHVLVQEVAYESVLIELRRKIHGRIAAILERISGDRLDELAPTLALHCERAQIWSRAIEYLVTAAERAARVFALPEALLFYDRAVELGEAHREEMSDAALLDLYENRGDVRALAYEFDGAETDYRIVLTAARQRRDHAREQRVLVHLGFLFRNADRWEESVTCLHAAQEIAREHGHLRTVADTLYHLGTVAWTKGDNITALSHQQEAIDICRRLELDDIVTVQALHGLAEAQHWAADLHQAIQNYRESITLARQIQDKSFESENLYMLALAHSGDRGTADYQAAMSNIDEALEISRTARLVGHMTPALGVAGNIYAGFGDFQRAFAHFTEAIEWSEKLGVVRFQAATYFNMGAFYRALNLFEEAYAITELGLQISKEYQLGFMLFGLHAKLVTDGLQMGDLDVEPELLQTLELARGRGEELHIIDCLEGLARRALLAGELHAVLNYADQLLEKVRRAGMREIAAQARILRGEALTLMEDWTPAEQELRQAQQFADSSLGIRLRWDAHAALEKLYRSWGKEEQAEQELAQVRAIVSQIRDNIQDEKLKTGLPAI
ncbi:MAG: tetratricopeptide repeat protein, partial [Candidatus Promineifilaceae bacterium]|nr:tetratricopeptide repeat protein [Candidatus Promineifilaceae bacterium]